MDVWIAGATGLVGGALARELLECPEITRVTALVRRRSLAPHPKLEELVLDFERLQAELSGRRATHVFCCLGTTIAKAGSEAAFRRVDHDYPLAFGRAAAEAEARKLLVVTAIGANPKSRMFYNRVKGELEVALAELALPELHLFRPSLLVGDRAENRPAERVAVALTKPIGPLLFGPLKKYRPIAASDVAKAMLRVALVQKTAVPVSIHESDSIREIAQSSA